MAPAALAQSEVPLEWLERVAGNLRWFVLAVNDDAARISSVVLPYPDENKRPFWAAWG
jgi:hypothetical protein